MSRSDQWLAHREESRRHDIKSVDEMFALEPTASQEVTRQPSHIRAVHALAFRERSLLSQRPPRRGVTDGDRRSPITTAHASGNKVA